MTFRPATGGRDRDFRGGFSRRGFLAAAGGAAAAGLTMSGCRSPDSAARPSTAGLAKAGPGDLYFDLLKTWCDGLLAVQIDDPANPARHGAFRCPACPSLHGRGADATHPLLYMADATGERKYLEAALRIRRWVEANVSQDDGSWVNDIAGTWKGITVFGAIALAESLHRYGRLLDASTRAEWTDRLGRAMEFLDGFFTMSTGNINYPANCALAFALAGDLLGSARYRSRGREFAHACLGYFSGNGLLYGEGKPADGLTARQCRPVDLGYNVEESLPALSLYAVVTGDRKVRDAMVRALRAHLEFMLPDGGWDNSWGTRQAKWTWWGSRTCDGCQPGLVLLAEHDPRFLEAARRNTELMAACTHDGLLHGGPHYRRHGDAPCVHHTFTHAKALATVLERSAGGLRPARRLILPREEAKGIRHFPEIGTYLSAAGPWRATVTEYDAEYPKAPGGHPSGGALSLLYHLRLGPVVAASMTEYTMVEPVNMQVHLDRPTMCLTPRIEQVAAGTTFTNLSDFTATLTAAQGAEGSLTFEARGRLVSVARRDPPAGAIRYRLTHRIAPDGITILVGVEGRAAGPVTYILPVVSASDEAVTREGNGVIRIAKPGGTLEIRTDAPGGWAAMPAPRVFNLVPGFECLPLAITLVPGGTAKIDLTAPI
jgi:hypothetical protein